MDFRKLLGPIWDLVLKRVSKFVIPEFRDTLLVPKITKCGDLLYSSPAVVWNRIKQFLPQWYNDMKKNLVLSLLKAAQWRFAYIDIITLNLSKISKSLENCLILLSPNEKRRKNWYNFRLDCFKAKFIL